MSSEILVPTRLTFLLQELGGLLCALISAKFEVAVAFLCVVMTIDSHLPRRLANKTTKQYTLWLYTLYIYTHVCNIHMLYNHPIHTSMYI